MKNAKDRFAARLNGACVDRVVTSESKFRNPKAARQLFSHKAKSSGSHGHLCFFSKTGWETHSQLSNLRWTFIRER